MTHRAPSRLAVIREARAVIDIGAMVPALVRKRANPITGRAPIVVLLPGFGQGELAMRPLRHYLRRAGFQAEDWGLGRNRAGLDLSAKPGDLSANWKPEMTTYPNRGEVSVAALCDTVRLRLEQRFGNQKTRLYLVGWSLGGYVAREAARDLPDLVSGVVTLASPIVGGPKYTAAARYFRKLGMDLDWLEQEVARREVRPIKQPITAIYTRNDGIIDWRAAIDKHSPKVTHIPVRSSHLGIGFRPQVWRLVEQAILYGEAEYESRT